MIFILCVSCIPIVIYAKKLFAFSIIISIFSFLIFLAFSILLSNRYFLTFLNFNFTNHSLHQSKFHCECEYIWVRCINPLYFAYYIIMAYILIVFDFIFELSPFRVLQVPEEFSQIYYLHGHQFLDKLFLKDTTLSDNLLHL